MFISTNEIKGKIVTGKKWQGPGVFVSEIDDGYYTHAVRALVVIIYFAPAGYTPFIPTY